MRISSYYTPPQRETTTLLIGKRARGKGSENVASQGYTCQKCHSRWVEYKQEEKRQRRKSSTPKANQLRYFRYSTMRRRNNSFLILSEHPNTEGRKLETPIPVGNYRLAGETRPRQGSPKPSLPHAPVSFIVAREHFSRAPYFLSPFLTSPTFGTRKISFVGVTRNSEKKRKNREEPATKSWRKRNNFLPSRQNGPLQLSYSLRRGGCFPKAVFGRGGSR